MKIEFDVKMNTGVLYDYSLRHTYSGATGIIGTAAGVLLLANFINEHNPMYLIFGIIIIFYLPVSLFFACMRQMKTVPHFKDVLHYVIDDKGISVSQGDASAFHSYDQIIKAVSTKKSIILYTGRNIATILPREAMGVETEAVIKQICAKVEPKRVKIRY